VVLIAENLIEAIRGVEPYTQVNSPAKHSAFSSPIELIGFIDKLSSSIVGKPVGIKLCIGATQ
jgi:glutamate synthase domain-containing protein 2